MPVVMGFREPYGGHLSLPPLGLIAMYYSSKVENRYHTGRYDEAAAASAKARSFAIRGATGSVPWHGLWLVGFASPVRSIPISSPLQYDTLQHHFLFDAGADPGVFLDGPGTAISLPHSSPGIEAISSR